MPYVQSFGIAIGIGIFTAISILFRRMIKNRRIPILLGPDGGGVTTNYYLGSPSQYHEWRDSILMIIRLVRANRIHLNSFFNGGFKYKAVHLEEGFFFSCEIEVVFSANHTSEDVQRLPIKAFLPEISPVFGLSYKANGITVKYKYKDKWVISPHRPSNIDIRDCVFYYRRRNMAVGRLKTYMEEHNIELMAVISVIDSDNYHRGVLVMHWNDSLYGAEDAYPPEIGAILQLARSIRLKISTDSPPGTTLTRYPTTDTRAFSSPKN